MNSNSIPITELEYIKTNECIEFFCIICKKRKIAKKYARVKTINSENKVCNACYGKICSEMH